MHESASILPTKKHSHGCHGALSASLFSITSHRVVPGGYKSVDCRAGTFLPVNRIFIPILSLLTKETAYACYHDATNNNLPFWTINWTSSFISTSVVACLSISNVLARLSDWGRFLCRSPPALKPYGVKDSYKRPWFGLSHWKL